MSKPGKHNVPVAAGQKEYYQPDSLPEGSYEMDGSPVIKTLPPNFDNSANVVDAVQGADSLHDALDDASMDPYTSPTAPRKKTCFQPLIRFFQRLIPYGGLVSNVFSLCSVTLGGGIIGMPSSFATSGIVMAVIYLVIINIATIYTFTLMGYMISITHTNSFEETGHVLFGRYGGYFVGFILALSCFGTAVSYVSAAGSLVSPILQKAPGTPAYLKTENGNRLIVTLIWLVLLVPVIIPKRISSLRYVSVVAVTMVLYFVVTIIIHSSLNGLKLGMRDNMKYFTTGNSAVYGLSIFVFSFMSQGITYSLATEMRPKYTVSQLTWAAAIASTICTVLYILAGVFGYFDFADAVESSILYNFDPVHTPYMMVAYIGMLFKICAAFSMNMIPLRNFLYYCIGWNLDTNPYWKHTLLVIGASGVVLVAGLFIPSINLAFGLVGSLTGGFISFLFPALFWMYCGNWSLKKVGIWHWLATYTMIIAGVIAVVWGTIATIYSSFWDS